MAQKPSMANPIANFYEAQTAATAEIAHAALNGMQRLQQLTLEAMRAGAGGQMSLAQSMADMRDGGSYRALASQAAVSGGGKGVRYQREGSGHCGNNTRFCAQLLDMERMRDALGCARVVRARVY